ncbi:hypothetical protein BOX15_Mlig034014g2 [Macrostomum lignano]|uniref:Uncharacterized protein n=1 Tax=Macrostomum lignano TaxID=282301 RepID=A0A267FLM7_9PLAT|nr:hypothetical protein BOX15_Mlig034014g2 [Macrostomum lignano]
MRPQQQQQQQQFGFRQSSLNSSNGSSRIDVLLPASLWQQKQKQQQQQQLPQSPPQASGSGNSGRRQQRAATASGSASNGGGGGGATFYSFKSLLSNGMHGSNGSFSTADNRFNGQVSSSRFQAIIDQYNQGSAAPPLPPPPPSPPPPPPPQQQQQQQHPSVVIGGGGDSGSGFIINAFMRRQWTMADRRASASPLAQPAPPGALPIVRGGSGGVQSFYPPARMYTYNGNAAAGSNGGPAVMFELLQTDRSLQQQPQQQQQQQQQHRMPVTGTVTGCGPVYRPSQLSDQLCRAPASVGRGEPSSVGPATNGVEDPEDAAAKLAEIRKKLQQLSLQQQQQQQQQQRPSMSPQLSVSSVASSSSTTFTSPAAAAAAAAAAGPASGSPLLSVRARLAAQPTGRPATASAAAAVSAVTTASSSTGGGFSGSSSVPAATLRARSASATVRANSRAHLAGAGASESRPTSAASSTLTARRSRSRGRSAGSRRGSSRSRSRSRASYEADGDSDFNDVDDENDDSDDDDVINCLDDDVVSGSAASLSRSSSARNSRRNSASSSGRAAAAASAAAQSLNCLPSQIASLFPGVPPVLNFAGEGEYLESLPSELRRLLKWRLSSITPLVVKRVIGRSGFKISQKTEPGDDLESVESDDWLGYFGKHMKPNGFRTIREYQKVNHFPGSFILGRKDRLWKGLQRMQRLHGRKAFGFAPTTYCLPGDLKEFKAAWDAASVGTAQQQQQRWIIKPPASARGIGIRVVNKWQQIPKKRPVIVQTYLSRPYLINGSKFDLRIYVYVTSFEPLKVYVHEQGLVRFASVQYSQSSKTLGNRFMHLTNYSVNKHSASYTNGNPTGSANSGSKGGGGSADGEGHKWSLQSLWAYLRRCGQSPERVWDSIKDLVAKTMISGESHIAAQVRLLCRRQYCVHELFGLDVLLDDQLQPWLLEVNISPSLHSNSPLDVRVKGAMVTDLMRLAGFQLPTGPPWPDDYSPTEEERAKRVYHTEQKAWQDRLGSLLDCLTPSDIRCLAHSLDEFGRAGGFQRILPVGGDRGLQYLRYMDQPRYSNLLLHCFLTCHGRREGIELVSALWRRGAHLPGGASRSS